ncbi:MAG TPA: 16S rRNA (cytidine(1402)-2'-O)-methyltransferase [Paenalcaligenes hominis]|uniref:Ribosomal RNA small subunit methyltransferase I n=1 Tax=Paenalcaligenes hominis TaxID=643674 RepID=A0A9D2VFJ4_9BURK|nr:16S rRNA (cytidine(1402)-2'-O)-methyltransferase [Paenalcaligenes hominis]NJB65009.1 16S rRNA (cytidine1402-2'-O)-methyltransferase [Paenalcaligenes hominis]HJH23686.1 16S rRNA (cytidine(1402)-2'-O)-methyltransferase [Paenalcaligenes hominis]
MSSTMQTTEQGTQLLARLAERVQSQAWPKHTLYVVATPIGNLGDFTLRGWHCLGLCDVIAAEDTRSTRPLLEAWGIQTPLIAAHRHNEAHMAEQIVARLAQGERVALVSDAGAPAVSDPGGRIVRAVRAAGYAVVAIPGASAVITALMASGVTSDENPAFLFAGFVPHKSTARKKWLQDWSQTAAPVVMFESPHRINASVHDMAELFPKRQITFARELTKRFEHVHTCALADAVSWLQSDSYHQQGEFVLILHAETSTQSSTQLDADTQVWLKALLEHVSPRDAVKVAVKATGLPRDRIYDWVLEHKA